MFSGSVKKQNIMELYQYTVKENNSWENETFNYVFKATRDQAREILHKCEQIGEGELSIQQTYYTIKQIKEMNNASGNSYMDFIWTYELLDNAIEDWEERGDCFYKGNGLKRIDI